VSLVWLVPRLDPVPALQWTGINGDELVALTEGGFRLEVQADGSAIGLINTNELVPVGSFIIITPSGIVALTPEEVRSRYDAV
jgi:hypothetical protein